MCCVVCFLILFSIIDSQIFLNAQSGWSEDRRLVFMQGYGWYPRADCCGDTIHLVWWQDYPQHDEVFYKQSINCGVTWSNDIVVSALDFQRSTLPTIGVNGNYVHVVWKEQNVGVCYRKSTDGGNTWLHIDTLFNGGLTEPWIHVDYNNLYVVAGRSDGMIIFTKSTDNGNTWQTEHTITHSCGRPRIKKIDSLLVLSHQDDSLGSWEIYLLRSTDDGQTWTDVHLVSQYDSVNGVRPAMDTDDSGGIHITWYDYKYSPYPWTGDIFYRASRDTGTTWEEIDSLTVMHRAKASDILAEGNNLHLVWEDDRNGFDDNFEIYYRMSADLGHTWGPEVPLTYAPYWSICPSFACGSGYLHLFWQDRREYGNNGLSAPIYYKRKDLLVAIAELDRKPLIFAINIEVYPNPFSQEIQIGCRMHDTGYKIRNFSLRLFDVNGKEVIYDSVKDKLGCIKIGTKDLPCGVYFVQIKAGDRHMVKKAIKIK